MRRQVLDPLSCLIKLALLQFYPQGTRVVINNNIVELQGPTHTQPLIRYFYGYNKEDISLLYNGIRRVISWYLSEDCTEPTLFNDELTQYLQTIVDFTIKGLTKLQTTYNEGNVTLALQYYINLLKRTVDGTLDPEDYIKAPDFEEVIVNYDGFTKSWEMDTVEQITKLLQMCEKNYDNPTMLKNYVTSIEMLLKTQDDLFQKFVKDMNS